MKRRTFKPATAQLTIRMVRVTVEGDAHEVAQVISSAVSSAVVALSDAMSTTRDPARLPR